MQENVSLEISDDRMNIYLSEMASYMSLRDELLAKLVANKSVLSNPRLKIFISGHNLSEAQRKELKRMFKMDYDIRDVYFSEEKAEIKETTLVYEKTAVNLETKKENRVSSVNNAIGLISTAHFDAESIFVSHTVRSGQRIESDGDIIIIGDVNAGAEVIAGGSIAVFGTLRGLAHAGALGREDVCIAAIYMEPKQIRVSGHVVVTEDRSKAAIGEVAEYKHGQVIIRPINDRF